MSRTAPGRVRIKAPEPNVRPDKPSIVLLILVAIGFLTVVLVILILILILSPEPGHNFLQSRFRFDQNDFPPENDCEILSGPTDITMNRGEVGKWWMVRRDVYCFKVTIEDGHENSIDEVLETVSRIPLLYLIGLEIVSGENENGMALYKDLDGYAAHGGRTYINMIHLHLGSLIHELGHAIEQEVRLRADSDLITRWKSDAMDVDEWSVSGYGNLNAWEDMAEFCVVYLVALQKDTLNELKTLSPNRYKKWTRCLELVNNSLRVPRCESPTATSTATAGTVIL